MSCVAAAVIPISPKKTPNRYIIDERFPESTQTLTLYFARTARRHLTRKEDCFSLNVPQAIQFQLAQFFC